jgi:predicted RNA-binding protein
MMQYWLVVGSEKNWHVAFENNNIWGLKPIQQLQALWNMLREGDGLLFYVSKPVHGIVGIGHVATKFRQTNPLWPEEIKNKAVIWPLRFEFDIEYCLPPSLWESKKYTSKDLQNITRMVFQCLPIEEVTAARKTFGLQLPTETQSLALSELRPSSAEKNITHDGLKDCLAEIGRIQNYVVGQEYPIESGYLDVVWRRVQRSVPTYAFEVQVGGDIYHAIAKLKHAHDLWNSHIFLVASMAQKAKYEELLAGTFHEVADHLQFIDMQLVNDLLEKKRTYREMERMLGIIK